MKRILRNTCAVTLMMLCTLPALAQLSNTYPGGYYRFRNAARTSDYISITNDKFSYLTVISTAGGGLSGVMKETGQNCAMECATRFLQNDIHMVNDPDIIDLATVIYAAKKNENTSNYDYNLIGQGTSLLTLTTGTYDGFLDLIFKNLYVTINYVSGSGANSLYTASMPLKASNLSIADLGTRYFVDEGGKFDTDVSSVASQAKAKWYIEPIDHVNVLPEVELNGKYYTTVKAPFALILSGQVEKAYKITANNSNILEYEEIASTGGTVPAGTPVLLQCGSPYATDCILLLSGTPVFTAPQNVTNANAPGAADVITPTTDNLLAGTYYCNTDGQLPYTAYNNDAGTTSTKYLNGNHRETSSGKYVIGKNASGKLGFIPATDAGLTYMPANKAWTLSGGLFPTLAAPVISPAGGTFTEDQNVTITAEEGTTILYSVDGGTTWTEYDGNDIPVSEGTTEIRAKAIKPGLYNDSEVVMAEYIIEIPVVHTVGDVNHDGRIDVKDVTDLIDYMLDGSNEVCLSCGDIKADGVINVEDITALIDMMLDNPTEE